MSSPRFGQLLSRIVPLSEHDLEEIFEEQRATRRLFGDAALSLGIVQPQHVWKAWIQQLESNDESIDLDDLGIDTQSLDHLPADLARQFGVIPVRENENELVVATIRALDEATRQQIQRQCARHIIFALARPGQVEQAIAEYYPPPPRKSAAA